MRRLELAQRWDLSTPALQFVIDLPDLDAPQEELIHTFCVLAAETQPGAIVGGAIIDGASATFDRAVFPSLPDSFVSGCLQARLPRPTSERVHRRCVRENRSRAQTFPLKHVSMLGGVVCTSTLASNRCNPLPSSALTGRLLVLSSWHSMSQRLPVPSTSN
jgi:hypothetical protein